MTVLPKFFKTNLTRQVRNVCEVAATASEEKRVHNGEGSSRGHFIMCDKSPVMKLPLVLLLFAVFSKGGYSNKRATHVKVTESLVQSWTGCKCQSRESGPGVKIPVTCSFQIPGSLFNRDN